MALTTTAISACNVSIWLDDVSSIAHDISGSSNSCAIELTLNLGEVNAFQNQWPVRQECGKNASIDLEILYTEAANEAFDILKDWYFANNPGARQMTIYIPDKNVGSDKFEFQARLESLSWTVEAGVADPIMVSASLRPDGEFTHTDVAT